MCSDSWELKADIRPLAWRFQTSGIWIPLDSGISRSHFFFVSNVNDKSYMIGTSGVPNLSICRRKLLW